MNPIRNYVLFFILSILVTGVNSVYSEIIINPFGIAAAVERNDEIVREISVFNSGEDVEHFNMSFVDPQENQLVGPRRDELGDEIAQFETGIEGWMGLAWDGELMWGVTENVLRAYDINEEQFVEIINLDQQYIGMSYDGDSFWLGQLGDGDQASISNIDREGFLLDNLGVEGFIVTGVACEGDDIWYYSLDFEGGQMLLNKMTQEGEEIVEYDIGNIIQDMFVGLAWVPNHLDGNLWIMGISDGRILQVDVNEDEIIEVQEVNVGQQETFGFEHDGENLWYSSNDDVWRVIDDGYNEEPDWISIEPREGELEANAEVLIEITFSPGDLENGIYELNCVFESYEVGNVDVVQTKSFTVIMSIGLDVATLIGSVIDAETDNPIANSVVSLDRYEIFRTSNNGGEYSIQDLPWGEYQLSCVADNYHPYSEQIVIDQDGVFRQNIELLHSVCEPEFDEIVVDIEFGDSDDVVFTVTNSGNGDLSYTTDLHLRGDANVEPWGLRDRIIAGQILNDSRVQGVVYIDDRFFVAGSNEENPQIYVLNSDGELMSQFDQFNGEGRYGFKDLAFDGELIWGSRGSIIYGFTPEGDLMVEFDGPFNPNSNLAWDSDRELLWVSGTTTDIVGIDREGNRIAEVDRNGLRIYGLSYWQDDPDGCSLFIYNKISDGADQNVHKVNPENGEMHLVRIIDPDLDGTPNGSFITSQYDRYSWVFISVVNVGPDDRIDVWQLDSRTDWMSIDRGEGIIEANQDEDFTLTLNSEGLPSEVFEGQIVITHNGVGGQTSIPITMNVLDEVVLEERVIVLDGGWNLVSLNIEIENNDIIDLTQNLVDNETLSMVKDGDGRFYAPIFNFNNIPGWDISEGYLIRMIEIDDLICHGIEIEFDRPIQLHRGWQLVSYYPRQSVNARISLSGIVDNLILAKDGDGRFYSPIWDFNNIGDLSEASGYQLNMTEDVELIYVVEEGGEVNSVNDRDYYYSDDDVSAFPIHLSTSINMSLLLIGDRNVNGEIAVYTNDRFIGSGHIVGGKGGIALWGDDPTTDEIDGALLNDKFNLILFGEDGKREIGFEVIDGSGKYRSDDFQVLKLQTLNTAPEEFGIISTYPNPFNSSTRVRFNLAETNHINLDLFDLSGRLVENVYSGLKTTGGYSLTIDATSISSGVYILQLSTESNISKKKLTLIK